MKAPAHIFALTLVGLTAAARSEPAPTRTWNEDVIYFAVTDRFFDGDPSNNVPPGSDASIFDKAQADIDKYHGGDLRGLELALQSGYFNALGVTAIWITPPVRNVWYSRYDMSGPKTGYHGYWTQDFLDIDPHIVSRRALDGREYPDSRDGRMEHYRDFVALAHQHGIKIVQDIVCNHAGPVFYYDENGNGQFDIENKDEWIAAFQKTPHTDTRWAENPKWGQHRTAPDGPMTILGQEVKTRGILADFESYGRRGMSRESLGKSDGEELECDFFGLRDFWTAPGSAQFDKLVDEFVEVYAFYVETIDVDGFRIDTVKHVHHAFWDAFTERLRKRLGPARAKRLILFGEVYEGSPLKVGGYTWRTDWKQRPEPCLDSVLHFPFCFAVRGYLRKRDGAIGSPRGVENAMRALFSGPKDGAPPRPFYNPAPCLDGLSASQKVVNFVENHDSLNRFRVQTISERRNLLANALMLLAPGIPCLYYGTEAALEDTRAKPGDETETGRITFVPAGKLDQLDAARNAATFRAIAGLCEARRALPALMHGSTSPLWVDSDSSDSDDGILAFARGGGAGEPFALVVINASEKPRVTAIPGIAMRLISRDGKPLLAPGENLTRVLIRGLDPDSGALAEPIEVRWKNDIPTAALRVAPESVNIFRKADK
jgi:glycosidase